MFHKRVVTVVAVTLLLAVVLTGQVDAAKGGVPGAPPDDPPPPVEGTIYYHYGSSMWTMTGDGGDKTELPYASGGGPTADLHNDRRWFLDLRTVGDTDGDGQVDCEEGDECYPNGKWRREIFAVSDDGFPVQLTTQADLDIGWAVGWVTDSTTGDRDARVSWIGRRWDMTEGVLIEDSGGIYVAQVAYDSPGDVAGLISQPEAPLVVFPLEADASGHVWLPDPAPDIGNSDWHPDGGSIVYGRVTTPGLWILDDVTQPLESARLLTEAGSSPAWSPNGARIAYHVAGRVGEIHTISTDGTDDTIVASPRPGTSATRPSWSPGSDYLLYMYYASRDEKDCPYPQACRIDIYRVTATGDDVTNLTDDIMYNASHRGWR